MPELPIPSCSYSPWGERGSSKRSKWPSCVPGRTWVTCYPFVTKHKTVLSLEISPRREGRGAPAPVLGIISICPTHLITLSYLSEIFLTIFYPCFFAGFLLWHLLAEHELNSQVPTSLQLSSTSLSVMWDLCSTHAHEITLSCHAK